MKITGKLIIISFALLALVASACAQSPREELQQMVEQLQKTPDDNALRKQIIKLAQEIKPVPAIPEAAREPFVMGVTMLKKASDTAGASKAADLFTQALNIAPWFAEAYYNRAIAHETAGQFEAAIDDLKLYLEFKLSDAERREVQHKIYSLKADVQLASAKKAAEEKAAEQSAEAAIESFFCSWYADKVIGTIITVDSNRSTLTYYERDADGQHKPEIVSMANISEANIGWTQTEIFPGKTIPTSVRYNFNRISGRLDYWYISSSGEPRANQLHCVPAK